MRLALLTLLLIGTLAGPALAAKSQANSCDKDPACTRLAEEAYEAWQQGRVEDARRAYLSAYDHQPDPQLLYNLARVLHKAQKPAEAAEYYKKYILDEAATDEETRRKAGEYLQQAVREARAGASQGPMGAQDATAASIDPPPAPVAPSTPLYRRWWLWTAVGVAAAGIAIGVGIGVASRRPDLDNALHVMPF